MFCSKCGQPVAEDDNVCKMCGNVLSSTTITLHNTHAKTSNASLILLGIGVGIAILVSIISIIGYGKIYFFNGYAITKFAWITAIVCVLCGVIAFIKDIIAFGFSRLFADDTKRALAAALLVVVIPAIFIYSSFGNASSSTGNSYDRDYYDSPNYYQDTFESCHSTYEHKQALYSYDLNNDNYLSEYELELFAKAHPRFVQDKAFVAWVEDMLSN